MLIVLILCFVSMLVAAGSPGQLLSERFRWTVVALLVASAARTSFERRRPNSKHSPHLAPTVCVVLLSAWMTAFHRQDVADAVLRGTCEHRLVIGRGVVAGEEYVAVYDRAKFIMRSSRVWIGRVRSCMGIEWATGLAAQRGEWDKVQFSARDGNVVARLLSTGGFWYEDELLIPVAD